MFKKKEREITPPVLFEIVEKCLASKIAEILNSERISKRKVPNQ